MSDCSKYEDLALIKDLCDIINDVSAELKGERADAVRDILHRTMRSHPMFYKSGISWNMH